MVIQPAISLNCEVVAWAIGPIIWKNPEIFVEIKEVKNVKRMGKSWGDCMKYHR